MPYRLLKSKPCACRRPCLRHPADCTLPTPFKTPPGA